MQTKQKSTQKQLQNATTFTGNGSHCHVCSLLVIKIKTCTHQLCKQQSADNNDQPILIIGKTADNRPIPFISASLLYRFLRLLQGPLLAISGIIYTGLPTWCINFIVHGMTSNMCLIDTTLFNSKIKQHIMVPVE